MRVCKKTRVKPRSSDNFELPPRPTQFNKLPPKPYNGDGKC